MTDDDELLRRFHDFLDDRDAPFSADDRASIKAIARLGAAVSWRPTASIPEATTVLAPKQIILNLGEQP